MIITEIVINVKTLSSYTSAELDRISEQICHFLAGPDGKGIIIGSDFNGKPKPFRVVEVNIKIPEQNIWNMNLPE